MTLSESLEVVRLHMVCTGNVDRRLNLGESGLVVTDGIHEGVQGSSL